MNVAHFIEEAIRYLSLRFVLSPAARVLPRRWAMALAEVLSLPLVVLPWIGPGLYWRMRQMEGKGRLESFRLARCWLGRGYRDFVVAKRVVAGRENLLDWKIVEKNTGGIDGLRASGESYIVATGHFMQAYSYGLYAPAISPGRVFKVIAHPPPLSPAIRDLRIRYQFGTQLAALSTCWGGRCGLVEMGPDLRGAQTIFERLSERGNVVFMDVDAIWKKSRTGSFERPFAGYGNRVFATGAAELARMTCCAVIACVHLVEGDETVVLDWGEPIRIAGAAPSRDLEVMNALLDRMERAVGDRPDQYALEFGDDRQWNPTVRRWEK